MNTEQWISRYLARTLNPLPPASRERQAALLRLFNLAGIASDAFKADTGEEAPEDLPERILATHQRLTDVPPAR